MSKATLSHSCPGACVTVASPRNPEPCSTGDLHRPASPTQAPLPEQVDLGPGPWAPGAVPVLWAHLSQHADSTAARSTSMSDLGQRTPLAKPHSHRQKGENRQIRASLPPRSLVTLAITITCRTFTELAAEDGAHLADVDFGGHSHMESTPLRLPRNPSRCPPPSLSPLSHCQGKFFLRRK